MKKQKILKDVEILSKMWKEGRLGGEKMPEDENPGFPKDSLENYLYFTLPMALNYQRNSYTLWESAKKTYQDEETRFVFFPKEVLNHSFEEVQEALTKYKVALQKNKQTEIWITLCQTFVTLYDGDIRKLFDTFDNDVNQIRNYMQKEAKKLFPYLCGTKICNYWLYVILQYTDREYQNMASLTVAPDTHVIKSTYRLGLLTKEELESSNVQEIVIERWNELFQNTKYKPIDVHTALWLWSRNGFQELEEENRLEKVLTTSYFVVENAKHVEINQTAIQNFVKENNFEKSSHWLASNPFHLLDLKIEDIVNFLVIFDSIDCSFWGNPKWQMETKDGKEDGSFALMYALLKLRKEKGHLNFQEISFDEFRKCLAGNVEIPLLKERYDTVFEISKTINEKMNGNFYQYIKNITSDFLLFHTIIQHFPSLEDSRTYLGKKVYFYKLAQLLTSDILNIRKIKENISVDCSHLVGCSDYKIPQVLRGLGILGYDKELSKIVDNQEEIEENSSYEVEIRASMIVAIDLLKKELKNKMDAIDINDIIWTFSQDKTRKLLPYHLTRTMNY